MRKEDFDITVGGPKPAPGRGRRDRVTDTLDAVNRFSSDLWNQVQGTLRRFEQDWMEGKRPAIRDYVPPSGANRKAVLTELVHAELELRLKAGEATTAAEYLGLYPELGVDAVVVRQLQSAESRWRRDPADATRTGPGSDSDSEPDPDLGYQFTPSLLGKYELDGVVGQGSFGLVYRARDTELGRTVAIKVPRPGRLASARDADRFLREARVMAKLAHPSIVPVHDAGRIGDTCFLVCEFIDGSTLAQKLTRGPIPPLEAADTLARVAVALEHAHRQGIVHRDLKPSNILLDQSGEPRLTDFGLAKQAFDEATLTLEGQVLGTPAYMSPEQASGEARQVDERSDIYSLGVVLYQAITGVLPFRGSPRMILSQILLEDPRPPRALNHLIPRDLETICLKAMDRLPRDRYPSAAALAADLRLYLEGEPIGARPISPAGRLWRRARRQPLPFALSAALILAVVFGVTGVTRQWLQTRAALARERRQSRRATMALRHSNRLISTLSRAYGERSSSWRIPRAELSHLVDLQATNIAQMNNSYNQLCNDDAPSARELVAAELALAQFNQGVLLRASGREAEAEQAFLRAGQLVQQQPRVMPEDREVAYLLAETSYHLAQLRGRQRRWDEAVRYYQRRASLLEQMPPGHSAPEANKARLARSLLDLGQALIEEGRPAEALDTLRRALSGLEQVAWSEASAIARRVDFSDAHLHIGRALDRLGRPAEAIASARQALGFSEELVRVAPANAAYRARLAMCHHFVGNLSEDLARVDDAVDSFKRSEAVLEALVRDYPDKTTYRDNLGGARRRMKEVIELHPRATSEGSSGKPSDGTSS